MKAAEKEKETTESSSEREEEVKKSKRILKIKDKVMSSKKK